MSWTQLAHDTFTDTPLTDLASHVPDQGGAWSKVGTYDFVIGASGTTLKVSSLDAMDGYFLSVTPANNQKAVLKRFGADMHCGVMVRGSGSTTTLCGYYAYHDYVNTEIRLYRVDNGSLTQLGSGASHTLVSGDDVGGDAVGTTIRAFVNETEKVSVTDATYAGGKFGVGQKAGNAGDNAGDDFFGYEDSGGGSLGNLLANNLRPAIFSPGLAR